MSAAATTATAGVAQTQHPPSSYIIAQGEGQAVQGMNDRTHLREVEEGLVVKSREAARAVEQRRPLLLPRPAKSQDGGPGVVQRVETQVTKQVYAHEVCPVAGHLPQTLVQ